MRAPWVLLLFGCTLVVARVDAQFPPLSSPEIAVSEPVYAAAPLEQFPTAAASNGDLALVAWNDNRSGATVAYAARVDEDGKVLDPLGIRLAGGSPKAVLWTGEEFLILVEVPGRHELFFIDVDGAIVERTAIDVPDPFVAAIDGEPIRLLFLSPQRVLGTESTSFRGYLVDPIPDSPLLLSVNPTPTPAGYADLHWLGGTNGSEILLLRLQRVESGPGPDRIVAERIDAAGDVVSATETGLQGFIDASAGLAGNDDGYVLVTQGTTAVPQVRSFRLTSAGAYTGETHTLDPPVPPAFAQIRLVRDGSRYLLAWWVPDPFQRQAFAYMSTVASDATFGPARAVADWPGTLSGIATAASGDYRLVVHGVHQRLTSTSFDLFGTKVTSLLESERPELLAFSATLQSNVRIAASEHGHLVTWGENGPDRLARTYVRRFSNADAPLDEGPVELYAIEQEEHVIRLPAARVAATGRAYVAVWTTPDGLFARRMVAGGSAFLDPTPLQIAPAATHFDVTTNGTDALVVWNAPCAQGSLCVMARRLAMFGKPDMTPPAIVHAGGFNHDVAVASDERDFLVAWSEGQRECVITCSIGPFSLLAASVGADGRAIDSMPMVIEERRTFAEKPAIAFDGLQYVVLWSAWAEGWTVRGARVTREGGVLETGDGTGTVIDPATAPSSTQPVLVALGDRFILFHRVGVTTEGRPEVLWTAVTFPAGTPLSEIRSLPREIVMRHPGGNFGSLDTAVSRRLQLLLAYDRVAEEEYAGVPRAFYTRFGSVPPARRRAATH